MKKTLAMMLVAAVLVLIVIGLSTAKKLSYEALEQHEGFLEMQLQVAAQDINSRLPRRVNSELRLDETRAGPGRVFTSFFTLLDHTPDTLGQQKREAILDADTRSTCGSRDLKPLLDAGVSIVHHYRSSAGNDVLTLTLTAQSCASISPLP